jgi:carboxyl-terminal processing protease
MMTPLLGSALRLCRVLGLSLMALSVGCVAQNARTKAAANLAIAPAAPLAKGLETFEAAWRIIYESHFDTNFNGVNWPAVREEFRPQAEAATAVEDLRAVIQQMLGRLGQSHMAVIPGSLGDAFDPQIVKRSATAKKPRDSKTASKLPPDESEADEDEEPSTGQHGDIGFDVRLVDQQIVVSRVEDPSFAQAAGVKAGWVVQAVGPRRLAERLEKLPSDLEPAKAQFMAWRMAKALLLGRPGSAAQVEFLNDADQTVTVNLERQPAKGLLAKLGLLPPLYARLEHERLKPDSGLTIGVIRFNLFMIPVASLFDQAIDEFRSADGVILDLRGNLGGIAGMVMGLAGHFLNEPLSLGTLKMRGNELKFFANPRRVNPAGRRVEPFSGSVAILTDGASLSAAEIFAGGMQDVGRARVFGQTTPGQALPAVWDRLPNGDVLYHAFADFVTGSGVRLEGRGVIPDEMVPVTRKDLLAGRDAPLLAALTWISAQRNNRSKRNAP